MGSATSGSDWPPLAFETEVWDWHGQRPSSRLDRLFSAYESSVPPEIADLSPVFDRATNHALNRAAGAIITLDSDANSHLVGVAGALLRSESVGSSKIELLDTDARQLGVAAIGEAKSRSAAAQVWANVEAMEKALAAADDDHFSVDTINAIHHTLMRNDPHEAAFAGRVRDVQNWIGGSDHCPRDALHVPPAQERVAPLLDDLARWCDRTDLPVLAQAAIAHAQFETIHPYTDGNGRTGRAIIHTLLRRGGLAPTVIVPTSAALLADVDAYFRSLGDYRVGDVDRYLTHFASATERAASEARALAAELRLVHEDWAARVTPKRGTTLSRIIDGLIQQPVISAAVNAATGHADIATIYRTIDRLVDAGVLVEATENRRNRVWAAHEVTAALDEFSRRIGRRQDLR